MCASSQSSIQPLTPHHNGDGDKEAQPEQPVHNPPWTAQNGVAAQPQQGYAEMAGAGIFAIPTGPSPEEIPGFPFFQEDETHQTPPPRPQQQPQSAHAGSSGAIGAIRPLQSLSRQAAPQSHSQPSAQTTYHSPQPAPQAPQYSQPRGAQSAPLRPHYPQQPQQQIQGAGSTTTGRLNLNKLNSGSTDHLATGYLDPFEALFPEPRTIQETGINQGLISDLVLKTMYYTSYMSGQEVSAALRLPFYGVLDGVINLLKKEQLCEVSGTAGLGEAGYQYILTVKGMERAHQVLARSKYIGAAPVPLARYIDIIKLQSSNRPTIFREHVESALKGMIIGEELTNQVGAAVNAGKSLFLFGAPGNGKTLLAERIATMLGGSMAIPYALEADGQIIQLFDLNSHRPVVPQGASETDSTRAELNDRRWVRVHRPVVVVGGELTMPSLDLIYNETAGFYEAPFQLKANGGLFLIDDFGRQQVSPQALLNRWIVPLEKSIDYLTLKTGKKLQIPFELFLVLSTNLQPEDLIDDAFLRRIQNKLSVPDPTAQQYFEIFVAQCKMMGVPFDQHGFTYLVNKHYIETGRPFRASQPRDLLRQLLGIARYRNISPEMTPQLLDAACGTYFVNVKPK